MGSEMCIRDRSGSAANGAPVSAVVGTINAPETPREISMAHKRFCPSPSTGALALMGIGTDRELCLSSPGSSAAGAADPMGIGTSSSSSYGCATDAPGESSSKK